MSKYHFVSDKDVLLGRGNYVARHPGNARFRQLVDWFRAEYSCSSRGAKRGIATKVVDSILAEGGHFVSLLSEDGRFRLGDKSEKVARHRAVEKTCQALRENKLSARRAGLITAILTQSNLPGPAPVKQEEDDTSSCKKKGKSLCSKPKSSISENDDEACETTSIPIVRLPRAAKLQGMKSLRKMNALPEPPNCKSNDLKSKSKAPTGQPKKRTSKRAPPRKKVRSSSKVVKHSLKLGPTKAARNISTGMPPSPVVPIRCQSIDISEKQEINDQTRGKSLHRLMLAGYTEAVEAPEMTKEDQDPATPVVKVVGGPLMSGRTSFVPIPEDLSRSCEGAVEGSFSTLVTGTPCQGTSQPYCVTPENDFLMEDDEISIDITCLFCDCHGTLCPCQSMISESTQILGSDIAIPNNIPPIFVPVPISPVTTPSTKARRVSDFTSYSRENDVNDTGG